MRIIGSLRNKWAARIASILVTNFIAGILCPPAAYALTGGPSQPEFSSFEPVGTADMVNKFTGDFSYNIPVIEVPGPDGSSYPLSLSYHSGTGTEDEASWVGYGWTLNPGAINRTTRGFPDDFAGSTVQYWNKTPKNWTVTAGVGVGLELFGNDKISGNANGAIRYNNFSGFGYNYGLGVSLGKGLVSLGYHETDGKHSFSARVNPLAALNFTDWAKTTDQAQGSKVTSEHMKQLAQKGALHYLNKAGVEALGGNRGLLDYSQSERATKVANYSGESYNVSTGFEGNFAFVPAGGTANVSGSYTFQKNAPTTNLGAYGYMYASQGGKEQSDKKDDIIQDFYKEKDTPYNERDNFLALPFNNADVFNVSGEGIGGAFRLHHDIVGEFAPNHHTSEVKSFNIAAEVNAPMSPFGNWGVGFDGGAGKQTVEEGAWDPTTVKQFSAANQPTDNNPYGEGVFFRFANDMGADDNVETSATPPDLQTDGAVAATIDGGTVSHVPVLSPSLLTLMGQPSSNTQRISRVRPRRSSYIGYHTLQQMNRTALARYCKRAGLWTGSESKLLADGDVKNQTLIGELAVTNESGKKYTYGLPLYSRNEKNLQYGVQGVAANQIDNNYLVYTGGETTKVGEVRNQAYATTYLLTDVTTPDYTDRTLDGPSIDDFGGYTSFYYNKTQDFASGAGYHWRFPYKGHIYERNSLSDPLDDLGSVAEGDKEVAYLNVIRTKSHTAIFFTSDREDGYEADPSAAARTDRNAHGSQHARKLDRIELYANSDVTFNESDGSATATGTPIKTVQFRYSYELCPGTPNSLDATNGNTPNAINATKGKLTLTKVWFEFNGVVSGSTGNKQVNPYEFEYQYPSSTGTNPRPYPTEYSTLGNYGAAAMVQNPAYSPFNTDAWGNYQAGGAARYANLQSWPTQIPPTSFDPAAWHLKVIRLPSKAEIHVQYEQDDYAYVQDRPAQALVSLVADMGVQGATTSGKTSTFLLDPASAGVPASQVAAMCQAINDQYNGTGRKIFFKFLYSLVDDAVPTPSLCNTDYVSGYADLTGAVVVGSNIQISLQTGEYTLPWQVCEDFVKTQRLGKLSASGNCDPSAAGIQDNDTHPERVVQQFVQWISHPPVLGSLCRRINPALSYFKVPLAGNKKGGGVRVKRLLTYAKDPAMDDETVLYGNEYSYTLANSTLSSGVATNEPQAMRGENALVEFIPRSSQSWLNKVISGADLKQAEGPLGESVLPGPSVGYSRVVETNIHSGKTNPGFNITEFYTAKEYPVRYAQTTMQRTSFYLPITTGLFNYITNKSWGAQGFSVILNNMHGQLKRTATYSGTYNPISLAGAVLMTEQVQRYFEPVESTKLNLWNAPNQGAPAPTVQLSAMPGREVDVTVTRHAVQDHSTDGSVEFDASVGIIPLAFIPIVIPFFTAWPSVSRNESEFYTHTTSKVIRYPAIAKSVQTYKDGIYHLEENLAFDQYSGKPVAVRSQDEFSGRYDDNVHAFNSGYLKEDVAAAWVYPEKRGKSENEGSILQMPLLLQRPLGAAIAQTSNSGTGEYYLAPSAGAITAKYDVLRFLHKGDLLMLNGLSTQVYLSAGFDYAREKVTLLPLTAAAVTLPGSITQIEVLASGNTNELGMTVGSTTYHKDNVTNNALNIGLRINRTKYLDTSPTSSDYRPFVHDFNVALQAVSLSTGVGSFTVSNAAGYAAIDAAGFYNQINQLAPALRGKTENLTINNMRFVAQSINGSVKIVLFSFDIIENGNSYHIGN